MEILTGILRNLSLSAAAIIFGLLAVSCDSDRTPTFSVSPAVTELTFSTDGKKVYSGPTEMSAEFAVSTNQDDWSVELSEQDSWLTVNEREESFTISAVENLDMEGRGPITVTVSSGKAEDVVIRVTQLGVESTLPTIYFAGRYAVMSEDEQCAYLKDGELGILGKSGDSNALITGVASGSGDIYMSGHTADGEDVKAIYWKGPEKVYLPQSGYLAYAEDIFISGSDIYLAGIDHYASEEDGKEMYDVVYWKNNGMYVLAEGLNATFPQGFKVSNIVVSGNDIHDIYVAGLGSGSDNGVDTQSLVYWKNDVMSVIEEGSLGFVSESGMDLAVSGGDVYIMGNLSAGGTNYGGYWKNGDFTRLRVDGNDVTVKAMDVSGDDVCIIGNYNDGYVNRNFLWKNGEVTMIESDARVAGYYAEIYDIAVDGGKAYISGFDGNYAERKGAACYWVDGITKVVVEVPLTAGLFIPEFIAVKK